MVYLSFAPHTHCWAYECLALRSYRLESWLATIELKMYQVIFIPVAYLFEGLIISFKWLSCSWIPSVRHTPSAWARRINFTSALMSFSRRRIFCEAALLRSSFILLSNNSSRWSVSYSNWAMEANKTRLCSEKSDIHRLYVFSLCLNDKCEIFISLQLIAPGVYSVKELFTIFML